MNSMIQKMIGVLIVALLYMSAVVKVYSRPSKIGKNMTLYPFLSLGDLLSIDPSGSL